MTTAADPPPGWRWLDLDGTVCAVREADHGQALELRPPGQPGSAPLRWPCWCYRDHLAALRAGLVVARATPSGSAGLDLDPGAYLAALPDIGPLDGAAHRALLPVALWWAGGGDGVAASPPDADGAVLVEGQRHVLRRWSHRERLASLLACLDAQGAGAAGDRFDAVAYLDAMVRHAVAPGLTGPALDALPLRLALPLIDAVVALNVVDPAAEPLPGAGPQARAAAAQTLRLCHALGWTPSQVWAAPAAEIDRLQALLDLAGAAPPPPAAAPAPRRLADQPDAVVIRIED